MLKHDAVLDLPLSEFRILCLEITKFLNNNGIIYNMYSPSLGIDTQDDIHLYGYAFLNEHDVNLFLLNYPQFSRED